MWEDIKERLNKPGKYDVSLTEVHRLLADAEALLAENASLQQRVEGQEDGLQRIVAWSEAYPLDVFPEPDFKKAHELLKAGGMTLDAISASNMRHVVEGVGKIATEALAAAQEHGEG